MTEAPPFVERDVPIARLTTVGTGGPAAYFARPETTGQPKWPLPSWCSVRPSFSGTRIMAFLAAAVALEMASGTSRALPLRAFLIFRAFRVFPVRDVILNHHQTLTY